MKVLIVESSVKKLGGGLTNQAGNCIAIKRHLERLNIFCRMVFSNESIDESEQYSIIIISSGDPYMQKEKFIRLIDNQKYCKVGWIGNDYTVKMNIAFKKYIKFCITNFDCKKESDGVRHLKVNLNCLVSQKIRPYITPKYGPLYFGSYRKNRLPYFKKYLGSRDTGVMLSSSSKYAQTFQKNKLTPRMVSELSWKKNRETLLLFSSSLYIEDLDTHASYSYLAARFYEANFCNTVTFFDESCRNTVNKSGYPIGEFYFVNSAQELMAKSLQIPNDNSIRDLVKFNEIALTEKEIVLNEMASFLLE